MGQNQQLHRVVSSFSLSALLLLSPLAAMPAHAESTIASEYENVYPWCVRVCVCRDRLALTGMPLPHSSSHRSLLKWLQFRVSKL
jgi:hypothetical protein